MRRTVRWLGTGATTLVLVVVAALTATHVAARLRETKTADELAPPSGRFVHTAQGRLFVQETGPRDGAPVVLVHGTAVWSEAWRPTMDALAAAGYRAIAFDVPPFGFSARPGSAAYARTDQAARIAELLDALTLKRAFIVAHSIGARGPMELLLRAPERVQGAILVCGALGLHDTGPLPAPAAFLFSHPVLLDGVIEATATNPLMTRTLFSRLLARKDSATDALVAMMQRPMPIRGSTHELGRWLEAVLSPDHNAHSLDLARFAAVRAPVALIWGEADAVTPLKQGVEIRTLIQHASLTVIPGVGHVPQVEDFSAFRAALLTALDRMR